MRSVGIVLSALLVLLAGCGGGAPGKLPSSYGIHEISTAYTGRAFINDAGEIIAQKDAPNDPQSTGTPVIISLDGVTRTLDAPEVMWSWIQGINNSGQIIAQSDSGGLLWDSTGQVQRVGGSGQAFDDMPYAINDFGRIAGAQYGSFDAPVHPVLWSPGGSVTGLAIPSDYTSGEALDINRDGWIVGYVASQDQQWKAVVWTPEGAARLLQASSTGDSVAKAINNAGEIVGMMGSGGIVWNVDGGVKRTLRPLRGYPSIHVEDINDRGQVVGYAMNGEGESATTRAVLWNEQGQAIDLGALPGQTSSGAWSINNSGQIVGWSCAGGDRSDGVEAHSTVAWGAR